MKKKLSMQKKRIVFFCICLISLFFVLSSALGIYVAYSFSKAGKRTTRDVMEIEALRSGQNVPQEFLSLFSHFTIPSQYGYSLSGVYIDQKSKQTVILCHGINMGWPEMIKFMPLFLDRGYNVIAYSQRKKTTGGVFEKNDLKTVVDSVESILPSTKDIGLMGVSLGGATVLLYAGLNDCSLSFVISDCSYSSLVPFYYQLLEREGIPTVLRFSSIPFADLYLRMFEGFSLEDANVTKSISRVQCPVLLIHGANDLFTYPSHSQDLFAHRNPLYVTKLEIVPDSAHALSVIQNPVFYRNALDAFLSSLDAGTHPSVVERIR